MRIIATAVLGSAMFFAILYIVVKAAIRDGIVEADYVKGSVYYISEDSE